MGNTAEKDASVLNFSLPKLIKKGVVITHNRVDPTIYRIAFQRLAITDYAIMLQSKSSITLRLRRFSVQELHDLAAEMEQIDIDGIKLSAKRLYQLLDKKFDLQHAITAIESSLNAHSGDASTQHALNEEEITSPNLSVLSTADPQHSKLSITITPPSDAARPLQEKLAQLSAEQDQNTRPINPATTDIDAPQEI